MPPARTRPNDRGGCPQRNAASSTAARRLPRPDPSAMKPRGNRGLRAIFTIFWIVGSIFWVLIGALDGDFLTSLTHIAIGWAVILGYISLREFLAKRRESEAD